MRKCKILYGDTCYGIENQVNAWLADNEGVEILSLHYQRSHHSGHNVLIFYNDNPQVSIPGWTPGWVPTPKPHYEDPFYIPTPTCEAKPC